MKRRALEGKAMKALLRRLLLLPFCVLSKLSLGPALAGLSSPPRSSFG